MRKLETIDKDLERCKAQIAATYEVKNPNAESTLITRQGFQKQLQKLTDEREQTIAIRNIETIDPRVVSANSSEYLGI